MLKDLLISAVEGIAKLLFPKKLMILRLFASSSVADTCRSTRPTPSGSDEENGRKQPQKGNFNGKMSFAIPSVLLLPLSFSNVHAAMQTVTPAAEIVPPPATPNSSLSYMIIDPKMRVQDFKEAFETLRKEKTAGKVFFQLVNGSTISNIIDMTLMANSTLILFRFNSTQGIRFQLVKVEEIASISYM